MKRILGVLLCYFVWIVAVGVFVFALYEFTEYLRKRPTPTRIVKMENGTFVVERCYFFTWSESIEGPFKTLEEARAKAQWWKNVDAERRLPPKKTVIEVVQ